MKNIMNGNNEALHTREMHLYFIKPNLKLFYTVSISEHYRDQYSRIL